ncbi:MAG: preprotein translocase subunit SecA [Candidatus Collierbacteria bacterium GW2011_GWC2_44_18]|uniref:Preprotein translocase subunit SecA n=1 Tax=Candidatus Collierbacteria bacterium GW2011_GWC2_44_18 TaxID=1618392 RepID=A0A0G1HMX2_9BACT|nr:MAG: preprotein translocase subunit SecA [Microgenomates group bacterium GW2011_GWC1_44_10]KKT48551.1 MAG: preprotein translocase subunit SecA [Candidatus Collierbacteria bacterium GW2011_GWC2_44_18]
MAIKEFQALTTTFSGKANTLVNEVGIAIPTTNLRKVHSHRYKAIWDTGATNCVITSKVVGDLGILPFSKRKVAGISGEVIANVYYVDIFLPNGVCVTDIVAFETPDLVGEPEMLIGMDIIGLGDFSVTQANGHTVMSYRIPSIKDINYAEEAKILMDRFTTKNVAASKKQRNRELRILAKQHKRSGK